MPNHEMKKSEGCFGSLGVGLPALAFACIALAACSGSGGATGDAVSASGGTGRAGSSSLGGAFASGGQPFSGGTTAAGGAFGQPLSGGTTGAGGAGAGGQFGPGGAGATGVAGAAATGGVGTGGTGGSAGGSAGGGGSAGMGGSAGASSVPPATVTFKNGVFWNDTTGTKIQAHGGGFLKEGDTYYWVGEDKTTSTGGTGVFYAVSLYSSKDLVTWEHRNKIITTTTDPQLNISNRVIERPKIIYNDATKTYVMWLHWDDTTYNNSYAGIFKSSTIDGNYTYVDHIKPGGHDSRDCTLFKDSDGTAYFISVANSNRDTFVYPLTDDYLNVKQGSTGTNIWPGQSREAPAIAKINGTYYAITSGSTGWAPNQGSYSTAGSITGPWSPQSNIGDNTTFQSQSTYIITVMGSQTTTYIYAGDRWNSSQLMNSQYVWLPLAVNGTKLSMSYHAQWSLDLGTGVWTGS